MCIAMSCARFRTHKRQEHPVVFKEGERYTFVWHPRIDDRDLASPESNSNGTDMISQTVEYALRAVLTLAQNYGKPCTAQRISEITEVPGPYLSKLMQILVRGGLVQSRRGLHGGFLLAVPPDELTVWDVLNVVEPFKRINECPLRLGAHKTTLCPLHRRLDDAMATVEEAFRDATIAALLREEGGVSPLCDSPPETTVGITLPSTGKTKP